MTIHSRRKFLFAGLLVASNLAVAGFGRLFWDVLSAPVTAAVKPVAPLTEEERLIQVISKASPAVVSILVQKEAPGAQIISFGGDGSIETQEAPPDYEEIGRGTGFLVRADGLIVTNRHVAGDRTAKITVFLTDERTFDAKIIDVDPVNDLSLLKIEGRGLPTLALQSDAKLRIGQTAIAIGNALGKYANTVTRGILSGVGRSIEASNPVVGGVERLEDILQTDAAINSGNSGGPLLDLEGKVIGVNTALEFGAQSLGFAIPVSEVRKVLESYARYGAIARPRLGVRYFTITPEVALEFKLAQQEGALVRADQPGETPIVPNSPAAAAGLIENDVIVEVNGRKLDGKWTLAKAIQALNVGDVATLKVLRHGEIFIIKAVLDAHPPKP
jgi:S1-C subfamily serine protease